MIDITVTSWLLTTKAKYVSNDLRSSIKISHEAAYCTKQTAKQKLHEVYHYPWQVAISPTRLTVTSAVLLKYIN